MKQPYLMHPKQSLEGYQVMLNRRPNPFPPTMCTDEEDVSEGGYVLNWGAPKRASVGIFIRSLAYRFDLECEMHIDKGWFRESGVAKLYGKNRAIKKFLIEMHKAKKEWEGMS